MSAENKTVELYPEDQTRKIWAELTKLVQSHDSQPNALSATEALKILVGHAATACVAVSDKDHIFDDKESFNHAIDELEQLEGPVSELIAALKELSLTADIWLQAEFRKRGLGGPDDVINRLRVLEEAIHTDPLQREQGRPTMQPMDDFIKSVAGLYVSISGKPLFDPRPNTGVTPFFNFLTLVRPICLPSQSDRALRRKILRLRSEGFFEQNESKD